MASILSTTSGAVLIGSSALDIGLGYRLKMRHDAAVQARIDQYAVAPPKLSLRGKIARLKGRA